MNTAYIAISYICNQKCSFCPCTKEEKNFSEPAWENLVEKVDSILMNPEIDSIVVSGGEPTLYSRFIDFIRYLCEKNVKNITILTTSEKFSNINFVYKLKENVDVERISVISTLHSSIADEHEKINCTPHSFERTILGLKNLHKIGIKTTVKHCITKANYKDLRSFYEFVDRTFDLKTDVQLCSIDYSGVPVEEREEQMLAFPMLIPYFEEMFDFHIERVNNGSERRLYCIYMPLCSADPYYWDFIVKDPGGYSAFISSADNGKVRLSDATNSDVGALGDECKNCKAKPICSGTYKSAFDYFGDRIIEPYN